MKRIVKSHISPFLILWFKKSKRIYLFDIFLEILTCVSKETKKRCGLFFYQGATRFTAVDTWKIVWINWVSHTSSMSDDLMTTILFPSVYLKLKEYLCIRFKRHLRIFLKLGKNEMVDFFGKNYITDRCYLSLFSYTYFFISRISNAFYTLTIFWRKIKYREITKLTN